MDSELTACAGTPPPGHWMQVELLGHRTRCGVVTEVQKFGATLLRIDMFLPGESVASITEYYSPSALYGMCHCTELFARNWAANSYEIKRHPSLPPLSTGWVNANILPAPTADKSTIARLQELLTDTFAMQSPAPDHTIVGDLLLDAPEIAELRLAVEANFHVDIPDDAWDDLGADPTLSQIAALIDALLVRPAPPNRDLAMAPSPAEPW